MRIFKKTILSVSILVVASVMFAQSNTTVKSDALQKNKTVAIKNNKTEWLTIVDSIDLHFINNTLEIVNETNMHLIEILAFEKKYYVKDNETKPDTIHSKFGIYKSEIDKRDKVTKLVNSKKLPIDPQELLNYKRVKSIQCNTIGLGITEYSFKSCKFSYKNGKLFFQKTGGSQRRSGYLYQKDASSYVFLGGWSVNNDPQTTYNSPYRIAGILYKVAPNIMIMIFVGDYEYEIYYITL